MSIFSDAKIYSLFPTPVVSIRMLRDVSMDERLAAQEASKSRDIYALRKMEELELFVTECVIAYRDEVIKPNESLFDLSVTTSFARCGPDAHPVARFNSHTSGLMFLRADEESVSVKFMSPKERGMIYIPTYKPNDFTADVMEISAGAGDLFLFPSNVKYQVMGGDDILYVGFNTFPIGVVGDSDSENSLALRR